VIGSPEKIRRHRRADYDHAGANPGAGQLLGIMRGQISSTDCPYGHDAARLPDDGSVNDESNDGDAIDNAAQDDLERIHGVDVGHAERGEHGEIQNAHAATEIAAVNRDDQLKDGGDGQCGSGSIAGDGASGAARQAVAEHEKQRGSQHEPGQNPQESLRRRMQQEISTGYASDNARGGERNHDSPGNVEMLAVGAAAGRDSHPERNGVGGVGGNGSDSRKKERGKGDEAAAARHCIERAAESSSKKQEYGRVEIQVQGLSRLG
jgi:hypothetical protein